MATIALCDVGPRDGLQNEAVILEPNVRRDLCLRLARAGLGSVEAASFVSEKVVPQMAGADEVMMDLPPAGVSWSALVLNKRGFQRALAANVREVHFAFPVTEEFCLRNQGVGVDAAIAVATDVANEARSHGVRVMITLAAAFGCPFQGRVEETEVLRVAEAIGVGSPDAVVLADTIGVAVPRQVTSLMRGVARLGYRVGGHFHNTRNTGYANAWEALESGCDYLESSIGGIGGCPFAPGATGNIATEDLVYLLERSGIQTGVNLDLLIEQSQWLSHVLGRPLPSTLSHVRTFT